MLEAGFVANAALVDEIEVRSDGGDYGVDDVLNALDNGRAREAMAWLSAVTVLVAPAEPLLTRIWELRANLSAYDAGYVAVAVASGVTLVTADALLARSG